MADQFVQLAADGTGKKVDVSELTVNAATVERQRVIIGDNATAANYVTVDGTGAAKVTQHQDVSRTAITLSFVEAAGVTSEAMATMTVSKAGVTSSTASYTVTAGKTLRITSMAVMVRASTTAAQWARAFVRWATTGAAATTSAGVLFGEVACNSSASQPAGYSSVPIPDGYEIPAANQVGLSQVSGAITSLVSVVVTGFEY